MVGLGILPGHGGGCGFDGDRTVGISSGVLMPLKKVVHEELCDDKFIKFAVALKAGVIVSEDKAKKEIGATWESEY